MVEGTQCTIDWYVDDNKLSHKNPEVILDIINEVEEHFVELSIVIGNKHTLLVMNIDIKGNTIQVDMDKQLEECIYIFGEDVSASVTSPKTNKIFEVREDNKQLSDKKGELFHLVVAKLLFIMKGSRPDLETAVSLLTTRVSKSDVDDWKN